MDTPNTPSVAKFILKGPSKLRASFTLVEILIVIAIIGILAMIVLLGLRGGTQISKARDARRKADMAKIQRCLEEYNNDHGYYLPAGSYACNGNALAPCVAAIPCDPYKNIPYQYETDGTATPRWYRLYAKIDYASDPQYCALCGAYGNYYVGSQNSPVIATPTPTPGAPTPTSGPVSTPTPTVAPGVTPTPAQGCIPASGSCGVLQNGLCSTCCPPGNRLNLINNSYQCCPDASCP